MRHYVILYAISIICPIIAMQPAQWLRLPQEEESPKEQSSTDWRKILAESRSKSEAILALRSMKINETQMNDLIAMLADRYDGKNRIVAAWDLDTQDSFNWFNTPAAKEWFKTYEQKDSHWLKQNFIGYLSKPKRAYSLLDIGFNPNIKINGYRGYYSPLDVAFDNKDLTLFERLLAAGADPNSMNTEKEMNIVERVAGAKNIPFLKALIKAGANRNPTLVNEKKTLIQSLEELDSDFGTTEYNPIIDLLKTGFKQSDPKLINVDKRVQQARL